MIVCFRCFFVSFVFEFASGGFIRIEDFERLAKGEIGNFASRAQPVIIESHKNSIGLLL